MRFACRDRLVRRLPKSWLGRATSLCSQRNVLHPCACVRASAQSIILYLTCRLSRDRPIQDEKPLRDRYCRLPIYVHRTIYPAEARYEGMYLIRSSLPHKIFHQSRTRNCRCLADLRTLKGVDLQLRLVHHCSTSRPSARVPVHAAYYVEHHKRNTMSPICS